MQNKNKVIKIYLASDHAGFELKEKIKSYLIDSHKDLEVVDFGAEKYIEGDDYTDYIHKSAFAVSSDENKSHASDDKSIAFVFGGSGEGESMVMNRYNGVRCTTYYGRDLEIVTLGRKHNNANSLSFGARFVECDECVKAIKVFLETDFEGGRHEKRVTNIDHKLGFLSRFF